MGDYIETNGAKRVGELMVAIHVLHANALDIEIFIPVDREISSCEEFTYLPLFELHNCISTYYRGPFIFLPNLYTEIYYWAKDRNIEIVQPFYLKLNTQQWRYFDIRYSI